jgi:ribonuclease HII
MIVYCDEVGVSSIAGPCCVCALATNSDKIVGVKDSKKLSKKQRNELFPIIANKVSYAFGYASPKKIERMNIHYAKLDAMRMAVERLIKQGINVEKVIVDGKFTIPNLPIEQEAVVKADDIYWQCSCASILAKVHRDNIMAQLSKIEKYSHYDWENNAGYFVEQTHKWGIVEFGGTPLHRSNFGYYQYCLFCRKKYEEFLEQGKTLEDYKQFEMDEAKRYGKSFYSLWKSGFYDEWKEIKCER